MTGYNDTTSQEEYDWGYQVNTSLHYYPNHTAHDNSVTPVFEVKSGETTIVQLVINPDSTYTWDNIGTVQQWIFNSYTD
eukprot:CAMPEP_0176378106 /NCGR_PEP_ID=MMETSP0126-20121128/29374_1 /TAXON_ID=141414 ORGANISM="Strombidinopsis acuminatum, Strain SPMC142" /NCGR_SAMPLE_ID=MMETSP0126 /ASSEMBLY_ACC=CAM_ASM_000229 /LENGTH=78 /DNA_ID=CAMNT_0017740247 /DNA_START=335 /DNA_END=571 /DNA_ORIENTATION=-